MPHPNPEFVVRLRKAMAARGIKTQKDLAALIGVAQPTVWAWFNQGIPQQRTLVTLCDRLHVGRDWLVNGIGEIDLSVPDELSPSLPVPPLAAFGPFFVPFWEAFRKQIETYPPDVRDMALKAFLNALLGPFLEKPERILALQLGISDEMARKLMEKVRNQKP